MHDWHACMTMCERALFRAQYARFCFVLFCYIGEGVYMSDQIITSAIRLQPSKLQAYIDDELLVLSQNSTVVLVMLVML